MIDFCARLVGRARKIVEQQIREPQQSSSGLQMAGLESLQPMPALWLQKLLELRSSLEPRAASSSPPRLGLAFRCKQMRPKEVAVRKPGRGKSWSALAGAGIPVWTCWGTRASRWTCKDVLGCQAVGGETSLARARFRIGTSGDGNGDHLGC